MLKRTAIAVLTVAALGMSAPAGATPVTVAQLSLPIGGAIALIVTSVRLEIEEHTFNSGLRLFESTLFTTADIGTTVYTDAASDPDFTTFVGYLTNGASDTFGRWEYFNGGPGGGGSGGPESMTFGSVPGGNGIDLAGFTIDRIGLRLDALTLNSPGSNPNHNGIWTDVSGSYTLLFQEDVPDPVPEPATLSLVATGLAMAVRRRRRR
jgi:hypothetical protein